jgi:hypothetical protein
VERLGHEGTAIRHGGLVNVRLDHKFSMKRLIEVDRRRARDVWNDGKVDVLKSIRKAMSAMS